MLTHSDAGWSSPVAPRAHNRRSQVQILPPLLPEGPADVGPPSFLGSLGQSAILRPILQSLLVVHAAGNCGAHQLSVPDYPYVVAGSSDDCNVLKVDRLVLLDRFARENTKKGEFLIV